MAPMGAKRLFGRGQKAIIPNNHYVSVISIATIPYVAPTSYLHIAQEPAIVWFTDILLLRQSVATAVSYSM